MGLPVFTYDQILQYDWIKVDEMHHHRPIQVMSLLFNIKVM